MAQNDNPKILIIVENLTVPLDRRVWQEAQSLREAGYTVSVICPKGGKYTAAYELLDGVHVFRHPLPLEAEGGAGYAIEYASAIFWEFVLSVRAYFKVGFDVVQACNPPDLIFTVGAFWKYLFGKPFVFDHHDINPELFEAKFGKRGFFHSLLGVFEKITFMVADVSIATNETFKDIAVRRGGMDPNRVFVVRSIPDVSRFRRMEPLPELRKGRKALVGYVGIMGAQDGVDLLVEAMEELVVAKGRRDVQCAIVGSGTELARLQVMAEAKGLADFITFTGFLSGDELMRTLSTFDVGVIPDPKNTYNDKISMNKVFEYMSLGIPFVGFDLIEGRKMAGDAALYALNNDPLELADRLERLVDNAKLREALAEEGRLRAKSLLRWDEECGRLLQAFDVALAGTTPVRVRVPQTDALPEVS
ncbi:MAG: glycosyltransferase family 4 protein [Alphaproteobacteria bacterium]|nr:glycosyltransferase family 4 protein [Alphaproteobacteria bacterium]